MQKLRRPILWAALMLIVILTILSIYGAFIGADRAKEFFNSMPLAFYWTILALTLLSGIIAFKRLVRVPGLLLMHFGCILVIVGGMWGSAAGHELQKKWFGRDKVPSGYMKIHEGQSHNKVVHGEDELFELPFEVRCVDFKLEHYEPGNLYATSRTDETWKIPAEVGQEVELSDELGTLKINRAFKNFKMSIEDGKTVMVDSDSPGSNPALEVLLISPVGTQKSYYVFELFPSHSSPNDPLQFSYSKMVSDYISDLEVVEDGEVVAKKSIQVNDPMYYGGYHFYQSSYDSQQGLYTVLSVTSDSGLIAVFGGFFLMCLGIVYHQWFRPLLGHLKAPVKESKNGN